MKWLAMEEEVVVGDMAVVVGVVVEAVEGEEEGSLARILLQWVVTVVGKQHMLLQKTSLPFSMMVFVAISTIVELHISVFYGKLVPFLRLAKHSGMCI